MADTPVGPLTLDTSGLRGGFALPMQVSRRSAIHSVGSRRVTQHLRWLSPRFSNWLNLGHSWFRRPSRASVQLLLLLPCKNSIACIVLIRSIYVSVACFAAASTPPHMLSKMIRALRHFGRSSLIVDVLYVRAGRVCRQQVVVASSHGDS